MRGDPSTDGAQGGSVWLRPDRPAPSTVAQAPRDTLTRGNEKQRAQDCEQNPSRSSQGSQSSSPLGVGTLGEPSPLL